MTLQMRSIDLYTVLDSLLGTLHSTLNNLADLFTYYIIYIPNP